ncbi:c-type cytochrome [Algihabitans albus]|uniref:c-type cytochrome n=1 Tax=Algihabitans albus TaxID=2164067 RepID=UPI000E5D5CE3|nr:cytochrome c family protein [Algihabitans albus]
MRFTKSLAALAATAAVLSFAGPALAEGDPAAGEQVFRKCAACHTVDEGGAARVGPNLWGIYGSQAGGNEAFAPRYSNGLKEADFVWNAETLAPYLANPREVIQGSRMAFQLRNEQEVTDVIAYLKTLSE